MKKSKIDCNTFLKRQTQLPNLIRLCQTYLYDLLAHQLVILSPQGYMRPLKQPDSGSIVDPLLVDEMFYQIPEILEHHEQFLEQVSGCVSQWHDRQTVGHLLIQSVSRYGNKSYAGICSFLTDENIRYLGHHQHTHGS